MLIEDDIVVAVTTQKMDVKRLDSGHVSMLFHRRFAMPISFADLTVATPSQDPRTSEGPAGQNVFYLATSNENGIMVYRFSLNDLQEYVEPDQPVEEDSGDPEYVGMGPLTRMWRYRVPVVVQPPHGPDNGPPDWTHAVDTYHPKLGARGQTISWLRAPTSLKGGPVTFATLKEGLLAKECPAGGGYSTSELEFHIGGDDPGMPAMYAMGVYDYDGGLGVAVFGNVYGELALCNVAGSDICTLESCFVPLSYLPSTLR